jgi:hypothetical protein
LQFQGCVAFLLDGVPHHVAGTWCSSKKSAQRDAAERALGFFVGSLGEVLFGVRRGVSGDIQPTRLSATSVEGEDDASSAHGKDAVGTGDLPDEAVTVLQACRSLAGSSRAAAAPGTWNLEWDGVRCRAILGFPMHGVHHQFGGPFCEKLVDAYRETARRVLWYLEIPGYEDFFVPDQDAISPSTKALPAAPSNWTAAGADVLGAVQDAERKTAVMRLQNRLQHSLGQQLKPGEHVWEWTYETSVDESGNTLVKATVQIPALGLTFSGDHFQALRDAQIELCAMVNQHLDSKHV